MAVSHPRPVPLQQQRPLLSVWGCTSTTLPLQQEEIWSQGCFQLGSTSHLQLPFKNNLKKKNKTNTRQHKNPKSPKLSQSLNLFSYACTKPRPRSLETEENCLVAFLGFSLDGCDF